MRFHTILSEARIYLCNHWINRIPLHWVRDAFYRSVMRFELAPGAAIHLRVRFDAAGGLSIGANSVINAGCRLDTRGTIAIGADVSISEDALILTGDHDPQSGGFDGRAAAVKIGARAWLGTRCMILPGTVVGEGAVVAAGAVVTRDVPALTIVGGVPAKFIAARNPELHYHLAHRRLFH